MTGPLDLSDANLSEFEALDPGRYNASVFEMKWDATKGGPNSKLPAGSPLLKIQFKIEDEPYVNRRVFDQFAVPPKDYDAAKRATMQGMLAKFFIALGFTEAEVKDKKFNPDFEDLKGREVVVTLGREPKRDSSGIVEGEFNNPVKGYKPAGSLVGSNTSNLL